MKRNVLLTLILASLGSTLSFSCISIAIPSIARELALNAVQIGWISLGSTLAGAVFTLPFGRLADIFGRKKIFTAGLVVMIASMITTGLSVSWLMLIASLVFVGIGGAMVFGTATALLSSVYTPSERGKAVGWLVAVVYFGQTIGPTIGGLLTYNFGWRFIVIPSVILQGLALIFILIAVKGEWAESSGEKYDVTGSAIFAVMLFCILYGFSSINKQVGIWMTLAGVCLLIIFVIWEMKIRSPMLDIKLLTRNRFFALSGLVHLLFYIVAMPIPLMMSLYLQYIQGFNAQVTGFILLIQPAMMAILSPFAGRISDKIPSRITVSVGIFIVMVGISLIFAAIINTWLPLIIIGLLLVGCGYAFFSSPNTNAIVSSVSQKDYGVASAFESTMRIVGMTFGTGILLLLFSINMGTAEITPEYYTLFMESIRTAFLVYIGFCFVSICISAARGKLVTSDK